MKKLVSIILFTLGACTFALAQADGPDGERIVITTDSGNEVRITTESGEKNEVAISFGAAGLQVESQKKTERGFTITLGGYEVAFTGNLDESSVAPGNKKERRFFRKTRGHLSYLDFGFNGLGSVNYRGFEQHDPQDFLDLRNGKSIYVGFNIFQTSTALDRRGRFGFTTGLSLVWRNYSFDNRITLVKDGGRIRPEPIVTDNFKKSKLTTFSLDVPILFEANFNRGFFLSAGGYAGVVVGSHTKFKAPKTKNRGGTAVQMFEYGVTARMGFRHMYIFGNYGLNDLFQSNKGPKAKTYTAGFSFPF